MPANPEVTAIAGTGSAVVAGLSAPSLSVLPAAAGPIGAAVAAAVVLIASLRSDVHLYATGIVNQYENPFHYQILSPLIDGHNSRMADGSEDCDTATATLQELKAHWSQYRDAVLQYGSRGPKYMTVAMQSLNNLNNEFQGQRTPTGKTLGVGMGGAFPEGFINRLESDLQKDITKLCTGQVRIDLSKVTLGTVAPFHASKVLVFGGLVLVVIVALKRLLG